MGQRGRGRRAVDAEQGREARQDDHQISGCAGLAVCLSCVGVCQPASARHRPPPPPRSMRSSAAPAAATPVSAPANGRGSWVPLPPMLSTSDRMELHGQRKGGTCMARIGPPSHPGSSAGLVASTFITLRHCLVAYNRLIPAGAGSHGLEQPQPREEATPPPPAPSPSAHVRCSSFRCCFMAARCRPRWLLQAAPARPPCLLPFAVPAGGAASMGGRVGVGNRFSCITQPAWLGREWGSGSICRLQGEQRSQPGAHLRPRPPLPPPFWSPKVQPLPPHLC